MGRAGVWIGEERLGEEGAVAGIKPLRHRDTGALAVVPGLSHWDLISPKILPRTSLFFPYILLFGISRKPPVQ